MAQASRRSCSHALLIALILCILTTSATQTLAFSLIRSRAARRPNEHILHPNIGRNRLAGLYLSTTSDGIADIEEINDFATENGIVLSFTTFGPGYRGVATSKSDPENILGYIEGFIRPGGKILHADKMEIFKSALNSARREETSFNGGGTFLGPGLLIAYVCLLHGKESGCQNCEFLAIDDAEFQHKRLVRYYKTAGFDEVRYVGEELKDIPDRLVWGGCGTLMTEKIDKILEKWTRIIRGSKGIKN